VYELASPRCGNEESPARVDEGAGDWVCGGAAGDVAGFCGEEWEYKCWVGGGKDGDGEWIGSESGG